MRCTWIMEHNQVLLSFYRILQGMGNVFRTVVPADRRHYNNGGTVIGGRYGYYINIMFKRRIRPVSGYCAGDGREHRNDGNLQYRGSPVMHKHEGRHLPISYSTFRDYLGALHLPPVYRRRNESCQLPCSPIRPKTLQSPICCRHSIPHLTFATY